MCQSNRTVDLPDLQAAREFLERGDDFILTSHINSDGDGIAGCMALKNLLRIMGKKAAIVLQDVPVHYEYLEGWKDLQQATDAPRARAPFAVVLDSPSLDRIGDVQHYLDENTRILSIDHHPGNEMFGTVNLVSSDVSSSCELVYHLTVETGLQIDASMAELLYLGILFDTGGFRYTLTTPTTFEVAAELVRCGARLDIVADRLFSNKSYASVKLLGRAIDSLELHGEGRVAVLHLSHEDMSSGDPEEVEVVNYGLLVSGVEVALLLKEQEPEFFRVSLRARDRVNVSQIAAAFGGGGHAKASGCRMRGSVEKIKQELLEEVRKHL